MRNFAKYLFLVAVLFGLTVARTHATSVTQTLPFTQNWDTAGLFQTNDNWNNVPGVVGFLGDTDPSGSFTNVDPQTILVYNPTVDVTTNSLITATGGGVHYIATAQAIALQGSGTADAPNLIIYLNTTGRGNIQISYDLIQLDTDTAAAQQFALQYRIGNTGDFTNVPAGYVLDAAQGQNVTVPVSVTLPSAVDGQTEVQVRILTTNAGGSDALVAIDNINITGTVLSDNPNIAVPGSQVFGPIPSSQTQSQGIVITNSGASNVLNVTGASISGTNLSNFVVQSTLPLNIAAGTTQALNVLFDPAGVRGSFSASLDLVTNDPTTPNVSIPLTATTTDDPNISAPFTLDFGNVINNTTADQPITISNTGAANVLNVTAATITGPGAALFSVTTALPLNVNAGGSGNLVVRFNPNGATGLTTATVALASNDQSNASINVRLQAVATAPIISGYNYLSPQVSVFSPNSVLRTAAGVAGGDTTLYMASAIAIDNDGSLLAFIDGTNTVGSSSQSTGAGALIKLAADGQTGTLIATEATIVTGTADTNQAGDINANGLAVDATGRIYLSEFRGDNQVVAVERPANTVSNVANVTGIVTIENDPINNRLLISRAAGLGGADEVAALPYTGGATTTILSDADFGTLNGGASLNLGSLALMPTDRNNLVVYSEAGFGGSDQVVRINNYNNAGSRTATVVAGPTAFPTAPGITPLEIAEDTIFGFEANAAGGVPQQWRLSIIAPNGQVYNYTSDQLDALFGFPSPNSNDDSLREVYPRNVAQMAATKEGSNLVLYLASGAGNRDILKMVFPAIVAVNDARHWNIFE